MQYGWPETGLAPRDLRRQELRGARADAGDDELGVCGEFSEARQPRLRPRCHLAQQVSLSQLFR